MKPSLIHPVDVVVEQLDVEGTEKDPTRPGEIKTPDDSWGSGAAEARKDAVTLRGQVKRYTEKELMPGLGGDIPQGKGHVIFDADELAEQEVTLSKGDRITSVAGVAESFYIIDLIPQATYGGKCYHLKAVYGDRPEGR